MITSVEMRVLELEITIIALLIAIIQTLHLFSEIVRVYALVVLL